MTTCKTLPVAARGRHLVHEGQEILAGLGLTRPANNFAARHFKGCKQRGGAIALVSALVALDHLLASRYKTPWARNGLGGKFSPIKH